MSLFTTDPIILFQAQDQTNGTVSKSITSKQPGRIKCQAVYWPASLYKAQPNISLQPGQTVKVVGRQGLTLLVRPNLD
jgi:membrane protein implicated in regulation of membrane protease activity